MPTGPGTGVPVVAAGTLLAGRHRLLRAIATSGPTTLWRAEDTTLSRPVAVRLLVGPFDDIDPHAYLEAATRAGRITHPRVARVLDAFIDDDAVDGLEVAAVVSEWVDGISLASLLRDGPLEPAAALDLTGQVLVALRATHDAGAAHGRLHPGNVVLDSGGTVTVTDAEVAAALAGTVPDDDPREAERVDVVSAGAVLYACLTGRWPLPDDGGPGGGSGGLEPAPQTDGRRATPRQVRAGVGRSLDTLTQRLLGDVRRGEPSVTTLAAAARAVGAGQAESVERVRTPREAGAPLLPGWLRIGLPLTLVALLGVTGVQLGERLANVPGTSGPADLPVIGQVVPGEPASPAAGAAVPVVALSDFDPGGDGAENPDEVGLAVDGDPSTAWETDRYRTADLGGLKPGVGLVVDLGSPRPVEAVQLMLLAGGADVELRSAGAASAPPASLDGYTLVAATSANTEGVELRPAAPETARYLLVWITRLPAGEGGFRAGVRDLSVLAAATPAAPGAAPAPTP